LHACAEERCRLWRDAGKPSRMELGPERPVARVTGRVDDSVGNVQTVCPYLGHRHCPPEVHPYVSSDNACYARPRRNGRRCSVLDHATQMRACLEPVGGWPACRSFVQALAMEVSPLRELPPDGGELRAVAWRRRKRRNGLRSPWRFLRRAAVIAAVAAFAALAGWALGRLEKRENGNPAVSPGVHQPGALPSAPGTGR